MPTPSLARTLRSIQNLVDEQEWYAAHQKYRTSAVRLIKSGTATGTQDAASLLYEGARLLCERNQPGSGTDLALMLIRDVYNASTSPIQYSPEIRAQLMHLIVLTSDQWRKTIVDAAVSYTSDAGTCAYGDPELHCGIGELLAREGNLQQATYHLLAGCSRDAARTLADVLLVWSKEEVTTGAPNAELNVLGKYAAKGVLGYLELGSILPARTFLDTFLDKSAATHPHLVHSTANGNIGGSEVSVRVCTVPSLNFLQLLILTCQVGSGTSAPKPRGSTAPQSGAAVGKAVYQSMVGRYPRNVAWLDAPGAKESLSAIGERYIGIKAPRQGGNMLGDLMSSLFGGAPPAPPAAGRGKGRASPAIAAASPALD